MSRRHKEPETKNCKPQELKFSVETLKTSIFDVLSDKLKSVIYEISPIIDIFSGVGDFKCLSKTGDIINFAIESCDFEEDEDYIKIPRRYFGKHAPDGETKRKRGRPVVDRLMAKIEDSKVVSFFKDSLKSAKKKAKELYQDVTQYCVCFLKGIYKAFNPEDNPYGKLSHYHRILAEGKIEGLPTRKTLSNHYLWFDTWRKDECGSPNDPKAKAESLKHKIWNKLIIWIYEYLLGIAPQYAVA